MSDTEGILNGQPPFRAALSHDECILWAVYDAEDSMVASVSGGEEMAEFFADALNTLAGVAPQTPKPAEDEDYMCENCVTPWKCNGPHITHPA